MDTNKPATTTTHVRLLDTMGNEVASWEHNPRRCSFMHECGTRELEAAYRKHSKIDDGSIHFGTGKTDVEQVDEHTFRTTGPVALGVSYQDDRGVWVLDRRTERTYTAIVTKTYPSRR